MNEMIERVLMLSPDSDRNEVENDLNITGDMELTINRALDGMLSPNYQTSSYTASPKDSKQVIIMDDDNMIINDLPSSSLFTNVREKSGTLLSNEKSTATSTIVTDHDNVILKSVRPKDIHRTGALKKTQNTRTDTFLEISDSDSENDGLLISRIKSGKLKSSESTSNAFSNSTNLKKNEPFRIPSPDSDSDFLPAAFSDDESSSYVSKTKYTGSSGMSTGILDKPTSSTSIDLSNIGESSTRKNDFCPQKSSIVDVNECISERPVKKRKKRSKEEIEEQKKVALLKREAKERERQEKCEEKKRQKTAEQLQKKLNLEKEKLQKQAEKFNNSADRLNGCVKFITVCLDPNLVPDITTEPAESLIIQKVTSLGANYKVEAQTYPGSITWKRACVQHNVLQHELKIMSSSSFSKENEVLIVLTAEKFAELVFSFKQAYQNQQASLLGDKKTLVDFAKEIKSLYHGKKVTFLLYGLEKFMRGLKTKQQRAFRGAALGTTEELEGNKKRRKKDTTPNVIVTRTDIEEALVDLQIKTNVCIYPCETDEDVAVKVVTFTKAVAEKPYKKSLGDAVGFSFDKLDKTSLKVSKDGQGMVKVWQQQIEQFRNVSRDMAAAIVSEFSSPQLLLQAYQQCRTEKEAMLLLEDILVRRGGGSLATSRRIGPELSKRVYILFHSKDSNELMKR